MQILMRCPNDNTELAMTVRQGVEIDYCPQCRGVWLDRGELDKILDRSQALYGEASDERTSHAEQHAEQPDASGKSRKGSREQSNEKKQSKRTGEHAQAQEHADSDDSILSQVMGAGTHQRNPQHRDPHHHTRNDSHTRKTSDAHSDDASDESTDRSYVKTTAPKERKHDDFLSEIFNI